MCKIKHFQHDGLIFCFIANLTLPGNNIMLQIIKRRFVSLIFVDMN